ncbi:DAK2 domain-containing protein [Arthrobacter sp. NEB 688]|uniref:DAK2 domain-containing protein n=1 Tax=Arthrobacter sp. NEB 688 TaxID=904039 RepID=UPI001565692F|nr:DAK2 domain-containing protein [Arthrobacter sp. NEB 688]QKE84224.1 DAK2 domain-containing protein [Arthrobacter sp. NEB 688]
MPDVLTAADARQWALLTRAALAARRTEIDGLNVFPVPDGDTGTNLYLTLDGAIDEVVAARSAADAHGPADLVEECRTLRRAVLLSARGNSGVILSQVLGGLCDVVVEQGATQVDVALLTACLERGAAKARASVAHPQEGTILTVADAAAAGARAACDAGGSMAEVSAAAVEAATAALARTPEQLPALARAGVVDAGGAGCVLLLEALHRVVTGAWTSAEEGLLAAGAGTDPARWHSPQPRAADAADEEPDAAGPAFEVMYLLLDSDAERVQRLTRDLDALGDSLIVVGGPDLWNVHVHVDDAGAAVEAALVAGRPERIRITHLPSQVAARGAVVPLGVVAGAAGPGVVALLQEAGAVALEFGPGRRASASQLLEAARRTGASAVVVLPADPDGLMAAEVAAEAGAADGLEVHVVPARTTVQAIAAMAVLDPERPVHANVVAMTQAAVATRHGAVSVATKEALTWAGVCRPGDVLGIVDGDVAFLGTDLAASARDVLDRLLSAGGELVTLVRGADADPLLVERLAGDLGRERPELEVVVLDGGQPVYPLLIGVE